MYVFSGPQSVDLCQVTDTGTEVTKPDDKEVDKKINSIFQESKHTLHQHQLCKLRECTGMSQADKERFKKQKDRFIHSWISETYCKITMIWWLVYEESIGMFCYLCRKNDTCNLQNKSKVFNKSPSIRFKKSSLFDHTNTDQHKSAIELELTNKSSIFQKQIDERSQHRCCLRTRTVDAHLQRTCVRIPVRAHADLQGFKAARDVGLAIVLG